MDAKLRIKQLMDERNISEYRLAKDSGLSQSTISNIFVRNTAPTIPTVEAICDGFGITLSQFFCDENGEELVCKNKDDVTIHDIQEILDNASIDEDISRFLMSKVDVADESCLLSVHLTQEETSSFTFHKAEEKNIALVQIRVLNTKGDAFVSRPIRIRVYGSINEGVI